MYERNSKDMLEDILLSNESADINDELNDNEETMSVVSDKTKNDNDDDDNDNNDNDDDDTNDIDDDDDSNDEYDNEEKNVNDCKIEKGFLSEHDLLNGEWLTDLEINRFLRMLQRQFPNTNGLEDTVILTNSPHSIMKVNEFVRIVLCNNYNHWVCIARLNEPEILLYDSLPRKRIDEPFGRNCSQNM